MRRDRPAASTSGATWRARRAARSGETGRARRLGARQGAHLDLLQQAADAHAHHVARGDLLRRRRCAAAPSRSRSSSGCARSPAGPAPARRRCGRGRSGCRGRPACRNARWRRRRARSPRGRHRAGPPPPRRRRSAAARRPPGAAASAHRRPALPRARTRSTGSSVPSSASTRAPVASTAPSMTLSLMPGSSVSTRPDLERAERMHGQRRAALGQRLDHRQHGARHGEGDDLDGGQHLLRARRPSGWAGWRW